MDVEELKTALALIPNDTPIDRARRREIIILINRLEEEKKDEDRK